MQHWLTTIWNIALLRAGPQDLPAGGASLLLAVTLYSGIALVSGLIDARSTGLADMGVSVVLPLAAAAAVLALRGLTARFGQTVAALFGTGALISLVNIPLWFSAHTPIPAPLVALALVALFWSLAVDGHIWRNALECSYAAGLMVAVLILSLQMFVFQAVGNPGVS